MIVHKKLIEVALPLEAINAASVREKSIRHGHPSTLHLWWARRPLAAARAVIFAQMVDDPSAYVDTLRADPKLKRKAETALKARLKVWEEARALADKAKGTNLSVPESGPAPTLDEMLADAERQRLFRIIEDLVLWENTTNETVLQAARDEIWASWRRACAENADHPRAKELFDRKKLPAFHDPFAGGGALPLEAQRLGLESYASDLNPVAVLINKAMIEIPPKFAGKPPVNPEARKEKSLIAREWKGAQGLAEDVRYYGQWMRDEAEKRIGHLYPKVEIAAKIAAERPDLKAYVGQKLTVIAWMWARTVNSPNPAFRHVLVPLVSSFVLSPKEAGEAYVHPVVKGDKYSFEVRSDQPGLKTAAEGTKLGRGANFRCLLSGSPITAEYIKAEGAGGRIGTRMIAIIAEGDRKRIYLPPTDEAEAAARSARPTWRPETHLTGKSGDQVPSYGMTEYGHLFTDRQVTVLCLFSDLISEVRQVILNADRGSEDYASAISTYLSLGVSRFADRNNALCTWDPGPVGTKSATGGSARTASVTNLFKRQAIAMSWDFVEANPFSGSGGGFKSALDWIVPAVASLPATGFGKAMAANAATQEYSSGKVVSTDPPYFDNILYADLSDFFYVWLRRSLRSIYPAEFATLATPKVEELVANQYRHATKRDAEAHFLTGMSEAMKRLVQQAHPAMPVTIFYAFKQSDTGVEGTASTGWEVFIDALINAGFSLHGTWPIRTELIAALKKRVGALASSIVIVCRQREIDLTVATRREFVTALRSELPEALRHLQAGNIAPVDLAQAAIGPGMAVYTRYAKVLDAEGKPVSVREALALINATLDEALAEQEGDFDADSRWALAWFEQNGFAEGAYGVAETLSKAKNTFVAGLAKSGIVESRRGKVRLLKPEELSANWDPATDPRLTSWEVLHHLIRVLGSGGESAAADLVRKLGARAESARELAYRLYTICERKKHATEAIAYNGLVHSWPEITRLAGEGGRSSTVQGALFDETKE